MEIHERKIVEQTEQLVARDVPRNALRRMAEMGLLDIRRCERAVIADYVMRQVRGGVSKSNAMLNAADRYNCSFEKIRNIIYNKHQRKTDANNQNQQQRRRGTH